MPQAKTPKSPRIAGGRKKSSKAAAHNGNGNSHVDLETEIRIRAYELFRDRAGTPGSEHEDWLVAEQQVRAKHAGQGA
jgi:Protein of unknown function (DUF2934)